MKDIFSTNAENTSGNTVLIDFFSRRPYTSCSPALLGNQHTRYRFRYCALLTYRLPLFLAAIAQNAHAVICVISYTGGGEVRSLA